MLDRGLLGSHIDGQSELHPLPARQTVAALLGAYPPTGDPAAHPFPGGNMRKLATLETDVDFYCHARLVAKGVVGWATAAG